MKRLGVITVVAFMAVAAATEDSATVDECPVENGFFADAVYCDRYHVCKNWTVVEHTCKDGLVFDENNKQSAVCSFPISIDCSGREEMQDPQPTENCPRQNGYFAHPDPRICDKFFQCVDGVAYPNTCPTSLVYHPDRGQCAYEAEANRQGCSSNEENFEERYNFRCPPGGNPAVHPRFPDPEDCQYFYICIGGREPQRSGCAMGLVFNPDKLICDAQDNVIGKCSTWYDETVEVSAQDAAEAGVSLDKIVRRKQTIRRGQNKRVKATKAAEKVNVVFSCPPSSNPHLHPRFPDPNDCQYFWICIGGTEPRRNGCTEGLVYNPKKKACDVPENVVGECRTWFGEDITVSPEHAAEAGVLIQPSPVAVSLDQILAQGRTAPQLENTADVPTPEAERVRKRVRTKVRRRPQQPVAVAQEEVAPGSRF